jgi:hypothetical protein
MTHDPLFIMSDETIFGMSSFEDEMDVTHSNKATIDSSSVEKVLGDVHTTCRAWPD